jgi:cell division septation protein DedD
MRLFLSAVLLISLALACGGGDKEAQEFETLPPLPPPSETEPPATPAPAPTPAMTPEPLQPTPQAVSPEEGRFTLQVAAWRSEGKAEKMVGWLKENEYDAYVERADLAEAGVYFRVRIGPFATRAEASAMGELLKGNEVADYWIDNYKPAS